MFSPCRLALTLEQIEALSRARAQREGGQRLGRADPTPWQYHPELASTAPVTQITLRLACKAEAGTHDNSSSKAAGAGSAPSRVVSPVAAAAAGGGVVSGTVGGQGSRQQDLPLYLTAALLADARELFVVHGASADEDALLHALAEVGK